MKNNWDTSLYQEHHAFVWELGKELIDLLDPKEGEHIIDLGCGTGELTAEIAARGAKAEGLDADAFMIARAREQFPGVNFRVADACVFSLPDPVDAVFSNATFHWLNDPSAAVQRVCEALRPGGRFVAEFGGHGNMARVLGALHAARDDAGHGPAEAKPWYFPSVSAFTSLLEAFGLEVRLASLFDRPTPLDGDGGMVDWLRMFAGRFVEDLPEEARTNVFERAETRLLQEVLEVRNPPCLYNDGGWMADYRRIRVVAVAGGG